MASTSVKLYVYDLSKGLARQMSMALTGRQIDGIWHTSVVAFNKEIFYGQGINITTPGGSHHGSPLRIVDIGETEIDEETFTEYLAEMHDEFTADKYHLLDFNCNTFTNACIGFLTGGTIPDYITSLPSDFLSTPFGAALRPSIDAMFRAPAQSGLLTPPPDLNTAAAAASPNPALAANLLQAVAAQAASGSTASPPSPRGYLPTPQTTSPPTPSPAEPPTKTTNYSNDPNAFYSLLASNRAVVVFFTSATCGPCRVIEPVFAELEKSKTRSGVAFAKVDLSVGSGGALAQRFGVRVTPTFLFFLGANKVHELRGANAPELRTQVDLLIYRAFPPHPHTSLSLPALDSIRLDPILFTQTPNLDTMLSRLTSFIDGVPSWTGPVTQEQAKHFLLHTVLPFLKAGRATGAAAGTTKAFDAWTPLTSTLLSNLSPSQLFPLIDIYRLALLNPAFSTWCATTTTKACVVRVLVTHVLERCSGSSSSSSSNNDGDPARQHETAHRNVVLTTLRMLCNVFCSDMLAREVMRASAGGGEMRGDIISLLTLSHDGDVHVRTACASLVFNLAASIQNQRTRAPVPVPVPVPADEEDEEWETELTSLLLDSIKRETSADIVHRQIASLGFLLRLSPFVEQMGALMEVVQARRALVAKVGQAGDDDAEDGDDGEEVIIPLSDPIRKDVRALVLEVAHHLCS